jgi:hypothetical protein
MKVFRRHHREGGNGEEPLGQQRTLAPQQMGYKTNYGWHQVSSPELQAQFTLDFSRMLVARVTSRVGSSKTPARRQIRKLEQLAVKNAPSPAFIDYSAETISAQ